MLILLMAGGTYVAYTLNLLGPMLQMANAASNQAVEIGKEKLRDFLEHNETARQALSMPARESDGISLHTLDSAGKRRDPVDKDDDI
jgi:protein SEY1